MITNPNYDYHKLYDEKVTLEFRPEKHWYFANGNYCPSVTGVTKFLDKSGPLMGWAVRVVVDWTKAQFKPGKVVGELELEKIFEEAKKKHKEVVKDAGTLGTLIHKWIQEYINNKLDPKNNLFPPEPFDEAIKQGIQAFLTWEKENKLKYIYSEKKIYSKKYHYAGTCDLIAEVNGHLSIVDFKTGSGPWYEHAIQTAAYQQAVQEELNLDIKERWIIKVDKESGQFHAHQAMLYKQDFAAFKALLVLYDRHRYGILTKEKPKSKYVQEE